MSKHRINTNRRGRASLAAVAVVATAVAGVGLAGAMLASGRGADQAAGSGDDPTRAATTLTLPGPQDLDIAPSFSVDPSVAPDLRGSAGPSGSARPDASADPTGTPDRTATPRAGKPAASKSASRPPGTRDGSRSQTVVLDRLPGDAETGCSDVGDGHDVRAGSFAAGNFSSARAEFRSAFKRDGTRTVVSLYWIPEHGASIDAGLTLTASLIGDSSLSRTITQRAFGTAGSWRYFLTEVDVPRPGTWRFEASAGTDSGCFEVTFRG